MKNRIIKTKPRISDGRGELIEIGKGDQWEQVNYVVSKKNSIRGKHYHKKTKELFFIIKGEAKVIIKEVDSNKKTKFRVKQREAFLVKPYEVHTIKSLTDVEWIALLSHKFDDQDPDIFEQ